MKPILSKGKLLLAIFLIPIIFVACGGGDTADDLSATSELNSQNYIEIAKKIYAKESGKSSDIDIKKQLPPGAEADKNTLYLTNLVKPRDYFITKIEAKQANNNLSIDIDKNNKYVIITLSGDQNAQTKLDMKKFTQTN